MRLLLGEQLLNKETYGYLLRESHILAKNSPVCTCQSTTAAMKAHSLDKGPMPLKGKGSRKPDASAQSRLAVMLRS